MSIPRCTICNRKLPLETERVYSRSTNSYYCILQDAEHTGDGIKAKRLELEAAKKYLEEK